MRLLGLDCGLEQKGVCTSRLVPKILTGRLRLGKEASTFDETSGLLNPLLGNKPESMDQEDWEELQAKAVSTIRLNLTPKVKYQTLKTTLLIGNETLFVDDVMSALMDSSRVNGTSSSSQGEGLVVRSENKNGSGRGRGRLRSRNLGHGKDMSKSRGKHDESSIECWYCKENGHIARKCPERKDKKNGKKYVNNANVAEEDDKSSDGDLYLVSSVEQQECNLLSVRDNIFSTEWFLDSACDVRYILDLKKNLISLGTLDSIYCSISIKGGVMKVSKGAMVIMKGQKTEILYKLIGNTVICGASVSTHVGSSNDNSELWHKRLGYLSERGMLELQKRKLLQGMKSCKLNFYKFCVLGKQKRRTKSADESIDGSTDEQSLEDSDEHPSDS
ncbi:hypothetical protein RJ640_006976 [Escallonia rubra]|uniref:CCHC-type domain-containing protein n=1 Tax=Escallonia rubra TaxID=112253 RepID=A0AA88RFK9_9ASTE|nr:hypothetical protein RJ640_006976 [Escallonia rubra]